ncbi:MAG: hypothetical protein ACKOWQ_06480 [Aquirufa sp.]
MKKQLNTSNKLVLILIMILVGGLVENYFAWYSMGISFGILSYIFALKGQTAFWLGLVSGFILWGFSAFWIDWQHPSTLPARMAQIFPLGGKVGFIMLLTGIIGGLTGGIWSYLGAKLRF